MTELTNAELKQLEEDIVDQLDEWSLETYKQEPRNHLGISEIGEPCARKLWYKFHWVAFEKFDGRMLRLFQYGHSAEERYIDYLEGIGFKYFRFNPETGKQWRVSGVNGHYGGSTDGVSFAPRYKTIPLQVEFKSHNTKSFVHLQEYGLIKSKPKHYDQMCGYGEKFQINYGLYLAENKNDSDIHIEIVRLDWNRGRELERKAETIINAKEPPPKISESPAFFDCKFCFAKEICHRGMVPIKNCRSCKFSSAVENADWYCGVHKSVIPKEFIPNGCDNWAPI